MKKIVKWFFRIFLALVGLIIIAAIVIPALFKNEILIKVKDEINKNVNAKVEFTDFKLSFLKSFPDLNIGMYDLSVVGIDKFDKDTLMYFESFNVEVNLVSVIKKNIEVNGIVLKRPYINAIVLEDSSANWDIAMPSGDVVDSLIVEDKPEEAMSEEPMDYRVSLQKFQIKDAVIKYVDATSGIDASLNNLNFILKGDFGMDYSDFSINTSIDAINLKMAGVKMLRDASFGFDAIIGANLKDMIFTFQDNLFALNDIELGFEGAVEMPGDDIKVDLNFGTKKTSFKSLLSMVPAIYMEGFEELKTNGNLILSGDVKGIYNEEQMPSANLRLQVENAMIQYPDLPKSVDNIGIDLKVFYDGVVNDNTKVDLNKFHLELAGNPFDIEMHISTPFSDLHIQGGIGGYIVLSSLADALPMEDVSLNGEITADVNINGNMSSIENEKYEEFTANGKLQVKDFIFESKDLPASVKIIETSFNFSPKYLELQSFNSEVGESDFQLTGRIENYISYALSDGTLKGDFKFTSTNINANEFMSEEVEPVDPEQEQVDTLSEALSVIEIPANIDFRLVSSLNHIVYDKMDITNLKGVFLVKDQKVVMDNLNMNLLDGTFGVSGEYNTQNLKEPTVAMDLNIKDVEIESALASFSMLESIAPVLKHCKGKVSIQFDYTSLLDSEMSPVLNSIEGYGKLHSKSIQVVDSKTLNKLTEFLKMGDENNNEFKDVNISFSVKDGRITVEPFDVKIKDIKMNVGGSHGIDQTMDYTLALDVPRSYFGSAANDALEGLLKKAESSGVKLNVSETIKVKAKVIGTTTDPKISFDFKDDTADAEQSLKNEMKKKAEDEARKELEAEAQKIIDDAEKEAAKMKKEARVQADKLLKDGNEEADKLVKKASKEGYLAKIASEKAAKEVKKEAKKKADKLVKEADKKADGIVEQARIKADNINKGD
jgi:vacuolar-type H+-ATPase subunit H